MHPDRPFTRGQLIEQVWGYDSDIASERTVVPHGPVGPAVIVRRETGAAPGAGIRIMPASGMLAGPAQMMQISGTMGVRVLEVLPDSPAAAAGLQAKEKIFVFFAV
jgi:hypothetical protein